MKKWLKDNTCSLRGKTVAISGSTGGLGGALCEYLAELGADLILLDRNQARAQAHRAKLLEKYPEINVKLISLDLSDLQSVENAAQMLENQPLDVLICNAGAYAVPRFITTSGLDNVFQINFAAPYYLIRHLMPHLAEKNGRVVIVGSIAHNYSATDPNDIDFRTRKKASLVYGNAKRTLMCAVWELFSNREDVTLSVTHPGIAVTGITAHYPKWLYLLIKYPMKVIFMHPRRAALSILQGVFEETAPCEWIGPRLFDVWGLPRKRKLTTCPAGERKRLAAVAEELWQNMQKAERKEQPDHII
ncbi:MAG: SDR family NAD(P)-dependent oxidoreductase [Clostridia bacterium]|nr:SDR family NAD(P)-dependent oxidoreductase [Clostridia bacterium]